MPQAVALVDQAAAFFGYDLSVTIDIGRIEQFRFGKAGFLAVGRGQFDLAEDAREGDMAGIVEPGIAPHGNAPAVLDVADFLLCRLVERLRNIDTRYFSTETR